jgi:peptidoglycan hydrolase CwlO-like protein
LSAIIEWDRHLESLQSDRNNLNEKITSQHEQFTTSYQKQNIELKRIKHEISIEKETIKEVKCVF